IAIKDPWEGRRSKTTSLAIGTKPALAEGAVEALKAVIVSKPLEFWNMDEGILNEVPEDLRGRFNYPGAYQDLLYSAMELKKLSIPLDSVLADKILYEIIDQRS